MAEGLYWLSDEAWDALEPHLPRGEAGKPRIDDRRVISGILHVLRTGCRWRDVPPAYGRPATIYNRFHRWSQRQVWQATFARMAAAGPVPEELSVDGEHIRARLFAPVSRWHRPGRSTGRAVGEQVEFPVGLKAAGGSWDPC
ncbi:transposase [Labrys sp. KNU-23]|nr:transposase [Labrys sp. KNU-23]